MSKKIFSFVFIGVLICAIAAGFFGVRYSIRKFGLFGHDGGAETSETGGDISTALNNIDSARSAVSELSGDGKDLADKLGTDAGKAKSVAVRIGSAGAELDGVSNGLSGLAESIQSNNGDFGEMRKLIAEGQGIIREIRDFTEKKD